MTAVIMFSNINEPLLTVLKENHPAVDLAWLLRQGSAVSDIQKNIVRADYRDDKSDVCLMVFPQGYHVNPDPSDPRWSAWSKQTGMQPPRESYMQDGICLYVY